MDTRDRKFGGHLVIQGASLTFFNSAIDSLDAKLNLKATELEIEELDLTRKNDFSQAKATSIFRRSTTIPERSMPAPMICAIISPTFADHLDKNHTQFRRNSDND